MSKCGIIVLAHGSRAREANQQLTDLTGKLSLRYPAYLVQPAYMSHSEPDFSQAVAALVAIGAKRLIVLPFFLWSGLHLKRDVPELIEQERKRHANCIKITLGRGLGYDNRLVDMLADRVEEALSDEFLD